ncbi:hypothetical protein QEZ40_006416 [Streptomyces katrae]|uniref:Uncharacterized protein n=1 Tax=Streptomyces katrae TaxID=68223 RepID=A0ABT7H3V4_9ACTN|nr:hypothetical protein [Streptomyces katrae]MDK9500588.1 hypothetical protein [Streptomyces katrae]
MELGEHPAVGADDVDGGPGRVPAQERGDGGEELPGRQVAAAGEGGVDVGRAVAGGPAGVVSTSARRHGRGEGPVVSTRAAKEPCRAGRPDPYGAGVALGGGSDEFLADEGAGDGDGLGAGGGRS